MKVGMEVAMKKLAMKAAMKKTSMKKAPMKAMKKASQTMGHASGPVVIPHGVRVTPEQARRCLFQCICCGDGFKLRDMVVELWSINANDDEHFKYCEECYAGSNL